MDTDTKWLLYHQLQVHPKKGKR